MLGGDDHRVHPQGAAVLVILHRDLALAVGPQIGHHAGFPHHGELFAQLLRQRQGQGHFLRRLVAGVAEHHALVPGPLAQVLAAVPALQGAVHPPGDVRGLLVNGGDDGAGVAVEAVFPPVVADVPHHFPGDARDVHVTARADFPHDVNHAGAGGCFAGHPPVGVLFQNRVQHRVGNLVAHFVGMALRDGLRRKEVVSCHGILSFPPSRPDAPVSAKNKRVSDETRKRA